MQADMTSTRPRRTTYKDTVAETLVIRILFFMMWARTHGWKMAVSDSSISKSYLVTVLLKLQYLVTVFLILQYLVTVFLILQHLVTAFLML